MIQVKICGITRFEDAKAAVDGGASMLGYNFFKGSARYIPPAACRKIQESLSRSGLQVRTVGVFVNASSATILEIMASCRLDLAQLSGDESHRQLAALGDKAFKGLRPRTKAEAIQMAATLPPRREPPDCLIDAYHPGLFGGTGEIADWDLAGSLAAEKRILLAGGLSPGNLAEAIGRVQPWGVDVASGVETGPGIKDPAKITEFVRIAQLAYQEHTG